MLTRKFDINLLKPFSKFSFKTNATKLDIEEKLRKSLNSINQLKIYTLNGECGQGLMIKVNSSDFSGLSLLDQHRMVNDIIKDEVRVLHSVVLQTRV